MTILCNYFSRYGISQRILLAVLFVIFSLSASASTYDFSYSGRLVDQEGKPLAGPVALKISFFHSETTTTSVLDITQGIDNVLLKDGVFQVVLSLDGSDFQRVFPTVSQAVYIEVTDLTSAPGSPYGRQRLTILPYAGKVPVDSSQFAWSSDGRLQLAVSGGSDSTAVATLSNKTIDATTNTITNISNSSISATAAIADTKLATISTAGKVSGGAITSGTIAGTTAVSTSGSVATSGKMAVGGAVGTSSLEVTGSGATSGTSAVNIMNSTPSSLFYVRNDGNVGIGTTNPAAKLDIAGNGSASVPAEILTGTWFSGGTATTTKPQLLIEPAGTTSNSWSTNGTGLGINGASSFSGKLIDSQVNGISKFSVNHDGAISARRVALTNGVEFAIGNDGGNQVLATNDNGYNVFTSSIWNMGQVKLEGSINSYSSPLRIYGRNSKPVILGGAGSESEFTGSVVAMQSPVTGPSGIVSVRNTGSTAHAIQIYGTYTDASNYVRSNLSTSASAVTLAAETAGTGADDIDVLLTPAGTGKVKYLDNGATRVLRSFDPTKTHILTGDRFTASDNVSGTTADARLRPGASGFFYQIWSFTADAARCYVKGRLAGIWGSMHMVNYTRPSRITFVNVSTGGSSGLTPNTVMRLALRESSATPAGGLVTNAAGISIDITKTGMSGTISKGDGSALQTVDLTANRLTDFDSLSFEWDGSGNVTFRKNGVSIGTLSGHTTSLEDKNAVVIENESMGATSGWAATVTDVVVDLLD